MIIILGVEEILFGYIYVAPINDAEVLSSVNLKETEAYPDPLGRLL